MENVIQTARDSNVHLPISDKVKKLYALMVKQGKSNLDHSALYLLLKRFKKY
jgi:3-hydroxyisobutyrate dehydrogenase-like beta-hydroxyacid dehydrogenase